MVLRRGFVSVSAGLSARIDGLSVRAGLEAAPEPSRAWSLALAPSIAADSTRPAAIVAMKLLSLTYRLMVFMVAPLGRSVARHRHIARDGLSVASVGSIATVTTGRLLRVH